MKLFKKVLSAVLSIGMFLTFIPSTRVFAGLDLDKEISESISRHKPETLEECCLVLDEIFYSHPEIKEAIKNSEDDDIRSYLRKMASDYDFGGKIRLHWLYSEHEERKLHRLFLENGADFDGSMEIGYLMTTAILDNYRHYLKGEKGKTIQELVIDYWFNFFNCFNINESEERKKDYRKKLENMMAKWKEKRKAFGKQTFATTSACTIL